MRKNKFKIRQHQKEKNKSPQTIERRNESICGRINLKSDSIKKKKTRVRKLLREETNQFAEELKEVLIQNLPKLNTELQLLVGEFLTLENQ